MNNTHDFIVLKTSKNNTHELIVLKNLVLTIHII